MKNMIVLLASIAFSLSAIVGASAGAMADRSVATGIVFAQEDCQDGEKWNEETQKCEKPEGAN